MKTKLILRIVFLTPIAILTYLPLGVLVYGFLGVSVVGLIICIILYPFSLLLSNNDFTKELEEAMIVCFGVMFLTPWYFWHSLIIKGEFPEDL